jgi:hypothetical protein
MGFPSSGFPLVSPQHEPDEWRSAQRLQQWLVQQTLKWRHLNQPELDLQETQLGNFIDILLIPLSRQSSPSS